MYRVPTVGMETDPDTGLTGSSEPFRVSRAEVSLPLRVFEDGRVEEWSPLTGWTLSPVQYVSSPVTRFAPQKPLGLFAVTGVTGQALAVRT